jgi:hypothetical protein
MRWIFRVLHCVRIWAMPNFLKAFVREDKYI